MNNLFIVYGSETKLLSDFYKNENDFFIKIYNNRIPKKQFNSIDVNNFNDFKESFTSLFLEKKPKKIIFIGAAFIVQNSLFVSEKFSSIKNMIDVNVTSYVSYAHFLIPYMMKIRSGNFIFLS